MTPPPSPARASLWEWTQAVLIAGNVAWTTLCLGGFRPETMIVTSALNGLLLAVHLAARAFAPASSRFHPAGWLMLPFLAYALINVLTITPVRWLGWKDWLTWAQMILVFWVMLNGVRATATRTFVFGALVAVAFVSTLMAGYQRFVQPDWLMMGRIQADQFIGRASGSFGIPNSLAALLLLLIPPLAVLLFRRATPAPGRLLAGLLAGVFVIGLVLTISRGAWLALAVVLAAWPIFSRGSLGRRLGLATAAAVAVVAGMVVLTLTLPAVKQRFVQMRKDAGEVTRPIMWRGAWQIFLEHRAWGGGAGSYNILFEKFRPAKYQDEPNWTHNDYLNTLSDYGVAGFSLFFGAALVVAWRAGRRQPRWPRDWLDDGRVQGALVAGLVAFALQLCVDFHFKIPALSFAFAIVAALVVQRNWPAPEAIPAPAWVRGLCLLLAVLVGVSMLGAVLPYYRGETLRYGARQAVNRMARTDVSPEEERRVLEQVIVDLRAAVKLAPCNGQAWSDLSYVLSVWSHHDRGRIRELGQEAQAAADQALARSEVVPEFWVRRGVALDMQGRRGEAGEALARALTLAPANGKIWYYQAFHLGLNRSDLPLALAAVNFCLRLDPGNTEAQSLRQRLASGRPAP